MDEAFSELDTQDVRTRRHDSNGILTNPLSVDRCKLIMREGPEGTLGSSAWLAENVSGFHFWDAIGMDSA